MEDIEKIKYFSEVEGIRIMRASDLQIGFYFKITQLDPMPFFVYRIDNEYIYYTGDRNRCVDFFHKNSKQWVAFSQKPNKNENRLYRRSKPVKSKQKQVDNN